MECRGHSSTFREATTASRLPLQMEEHEEALNLLVRKLEDYQGAKNYCATYSKVQRSHIHIYTYGNMTVV